MVVKNEQIPEDAEMPKLGFLFTKLSNSERKGGDDYVCDAETLKTIRRRYIEGVDEPEVDLIDEFTNIINYMEEEGGRAERIKSMRVNQVKTMLGKCWKVSYPNPSKNDYSDKFFFKPLRMHNDDMIIGLVSPISPNYQGTSVGELIKSPLYETTFFFLNWGSESPDGIYFSECDESEMIENAKNLVDIIMEEEKPVIETLSNTTRILSISGVCHLEAEH